MHEEASEKNKDQKFGEMRMNKRPGWKTVFAYTAGIVTLTVAVVIAWFLPEWYGQWQDERLMGQVTLSSRENIEFINSDSLDMAGRLQMLGQGKKFYWSDFFGYDIGYEENYSVTKCRRILDKWYECGLLPIDCREWVSGEHEVLLISATLFVDNTAIPVYFLAFTDCRMYDETSDYATGMLLVLMDSAKDIIYYISVSGDAVRDEMAVELGYESCAKMLENLWEGGEPPRKETDRSQLDFASICEAETAQITAEEGSLDLTVSLAFESFEGYAGRMIVSNEQGIGMAVMLGTERWKDLIPQILERLDSYEEYMSTEEWLQMIKNENYDAVLGETEAVQDASACLDSNNYFSSG